MSFNTSGHYNKKSGQEKLVSLPAGARGSILHYVMKCQVFSCSISNGPRSTSTNTWYLPLKSFGTRHEYRQLLPQPNLKLPASTMFPISSTILTLAFRTVRLSFHRKFLVTLPGLPDNRIVYFNKRAVPADF